MVGYLIDNNTNSNNDNNSVPKKNKNNDNNSGRVCAKGKHDIVPP